VQVCPTGIDIRNGLQLECVGCAACIDACDEVMTRISRPKGLVRYDSFNGLTGNPRRFLRPRVYVYGALAALGLAAMILVAAHHARPFNVTISRAGGAGFYRDANSIRNIYQIRFFNKRNQGATVTIRLGKGTPDGYQLSGAEQPFPVAARNEISRACVVIAPVDVYAGVSDIVLEVHANPGDVTLVKNVRFLGPNPQSLESPEIPTSPQSAAP
jgi:polyferredoxin